MSLNVSTLTVLSICVCIINTSRYCHIDNNNNNNNNNNNDDDDDDDD